MSVEPVSFPNAPRPAARRRRSAPAKQNDLFEAVEFYRAAAKRCRPEYGSVYDAVTKLRAAGSKVFRVSRKQHTVDGRLVSTRQLLDLASCC